MRICEWLQNKKTQLGYTDWMMASVTEVPLSTLQCNLYGYNFPSIRTFIKYCSAFNVPKDNWKNLYEAFKEEEMKKKT